jgi:hypothetical protein
MYVVYAVDIHNNVDSSSVKDCRIRLDVTFNLDIKLWYFVISRGRPSTKRMQRGLRS